MSFVSLIRMGVLIALRRTAADLRLQSAAGFGMVLAVALMAASVIYSNALRETALDYTLRTAERDSLHLVISESHALDSDLFQATNEIVVERISKRLSPYIDGSALQIETSTIMYSGLPQFDNPASGKPHRGPVYSLKDVQEHLRGIEGRLPSSESDALEVVTDLQGATALGLAVGDRFHALPAVADGVQPLSIQLTGLIEPIDQKQRSGGWVLPADRHGLIKNGLLSHFMLTAKHCSIQWEQPSPTSTPTIDGHSLLIMRACVP